MTYRARANINPAEVTSIATAIAGTTASATGTGRPPNSGIQRGNLSPHGRMPGIDGLELTRRLAGTGPRVIVVTTFDLDDYVTTALRDGAYGFLLKRSGPALLVEAVRSAVAGDTLISPQLTVRLLRRLSTAPSALAGADALTVRELEVARSVAHGSTNAEIAAELAISAGTVKTHVANIQTKLGARNRVGIAAWAWSTGQAV
ncbi:response regulator transcription factor [Micromonospora sp. NPDC048999]|uniref:response regulator transcription factor n=1 Tax=Micromonospora sp. NPDC048999 TaxID=3155391 RepID=UPI0033DF1F7C